MSGALGRAGVRAGEARAALSRTVLELVDGLAEAVAFGNQEGWTVSLEQADSRLQRAQRREWLVAAIEPGLELAASHLAGWLVLVVAIGSVRSGAITGIELAVICLVTIASFEALNPLTSAARELASSRAAARRISSIVEVSPPVSDPETPLPGALLEGEPSGPGLELSGVWFTYPGQDRPALEDLDLVIEPGSRVGLVGASGSGKTTVMRLLQRYWDPQRGNVLINGHDLRDLALEDLRLAVAAFDQEPGLLHGTIRDNLLLARPGALDDELVIALRSVAFDLREDRLVDGLDTWIGDRGTALSGGQQQRLALARVVLRSPSVLLLDEPLAALDTVARQSAWETLCRLMAGRTCVVVSHRLSDMQQLDCVVVVDAGRVVQQGSYDELVERDGVYRKLWLHERGALST
jgi:ABC-type multidrug transport system fused ATPase/permease subunit